MFGRYVVISVPAKSKGVSTSGQVCEVVRPRRKPRELAARRPAVTLRLPKGGPVIEIDNPWVGALAVVGVLAAWYAGGKFLPPIRS
jgi:hypothetical protein